MLTFFLAIGTPLLIAFYFIKSDKFPEPQDLIIKTFFLGVLMIGVFVIGAGAGAVGGEALNDYNFDKNSLSPGLQLMPIDSNFDS